MPFLPKSAVPITTDLLLRQGAADRAAEEQVALFSVPPGYVLTESVAAALAEHDRPIAWLRLGPEDADPATFLISLVTAAQHISPDAGRATIEKMRCQPGPVLGWPPLFTHLGREFAERLPASTALVLENGHYLDRTHPLLGLLMSRLLPELPANTVCILTTEHALPRAGLPEGSVCMGVSEMRLDASTAWALSKRVAPELPFTCVERVVKISEGRIAVLAGLLAATQILGGNLAERLVKHARKGEDLLAQIAQTWIALLDPDTRKGLALALRIGYAHPALIETSLSSSVSLTGPWYQPLIGGWVKTREIWRIPLDAALRGVVNLPADAICRAADYLSSQGALEQAVSLYFALGDRPRAAQVIAGSAETLMNLGQWQTLSGWLGGLPAASIQAWPWLIYYGGEIAAATGDVRYARSAFAQAVALFTTQHNTAGTCQSLLSESALAAWQGESSLAQSRAFTASALAEAEGLAWHRCWAGWQLGCLAALGQDEAASVHFSSAVNAVDEVGDPLLVELLHRSEALALQRNELHRQGELSHQAYLATVSAEQATAQQLHLLVSWPPDNLPDLLHTHSWSQLPLILKLPGQAPAQAPAALSEHTSLWSTVLNALGLTRRRESSAPLAASADASLGPEILPPIPIADPELAPLTTPASAAPTASVYIVSPEVTPAVALSVHLLGRFDIAVDDQPVLSWPSARGRTVLQYLLTHHARATPRDVLMDVFWPAAGPEAARNNLNVALHGVRQALRTVTDQQLILFQDGAYHLRPDLCLWFDIDDFEGHAHAGLRLEAAGQVAPAVTEYEAAAGLYQGDFLEEAPYEEWAALTREQLRVTYLDVLDHLSRIYFGQGHYAPCAGLCHLILGRDSGREDIHRRLMRCYSREGQHHLALRQYHACVEALRSELDLAPAPATTQLFERIRRRERV